MDRSTADTAHHLAKSTLSLQDVFGAVRTQARQEQAVGRYRAVSDTTSSRDTTDSYSGSLMTAKPGRPQTLDKRFSSMANVADAEGSQIDGLNETARTTVDDAKGDQEESPAEDFWEKTTVHSGSAQRNDVSSQSDDGDIERGYARIKEEGEEAQMGFYDDESASSSGCIEKGEGLQQTEAAVTFDVPKWEDYTKTTDGLKQNRIVRDAGRAEQTNGDVHGRAGGDVGGVGGEGGNPEELVAGVQVELVFKTEELEQDDSTAQVSSRGDTTPPETPTTASEEDELGSAAESDGAGCMDGEDIGRVKNTAERDLMVNESEHVQHEDGKGKELLSVDNTPAASLATTKAKETGSEPEGSRVGRTDSEVGGVITFEINQRELGNTDDLLQGDIGDEQMLLPFNGGPTASVLASEAQDIDARHVNVSERDAGTSKTADNIGPESVEGNGEELVKKGTDTSSLVREIADLRDGEDDDRQGRSVRETDHDDGPISCSVITDGAREGVDDKTHEEQEQQTRKAVASTTGEGVIEGREGREVGSNSTGTSETAEETSSESDCTVKGDPFATTGTKTLEPADGVEGTADRRDRHAIDAPSVQETRNMDDDIVGISLVDREVEVGTYRERQPDTSAIVATAAKIEKCLGGGNEDACIVRHIVQSRGVRSEGKGRTSDLVAEETAEGAAPTAAHEIPRPAHGQSIRNGSGHDTERGGHDSTKSTLVNGSTFGDEGVEGRGGESLNWAEKLPDAIVNSIFGCKHSGMVKPKHSSAVGVVTRDDDVDMEDRCRGNRENTSDSGASKHAANHKDVASLSAKASRAAVGDDGDDVPQNDQYPRASEPEKAVHGDALQTGGGTAQPVLPFDSVTSEIGLKITDQFGGGGGGWDALRKSEAGEGMKGLGCIDSAPSMQDGDKHTPPDMSCNASPPSYVVGTMLGDQIQGRYPQPWVVSEAQSATACPVQTARPGKEWPPEAGSRRSETGEQCLPNTVRDHIEQSTDDAIKTCANYRETVGGEVDAVAGRQEQRLEQRAYGTGGQTMCEESFSERVETEEKNIAFGNTQSAGKHDRDPAFGTPIAKAGENMETREKLEGVLPSTARVIHGDAEGPAITEVAELGERPPSVGMNKAIVGERVIAGEQKEKPTTLQADDENEIAPDAPCAGENPINPNFARTQIQTNCCRRKEPARTSQELREEEGRDRDQTHKAGPGRVSYDRQQQQEYQRCQAERERAAIIIQTRQRALRIRMSRAAESQVCRDEQFRFGPGFYCVDHMHAHRRSSTFEKEKRTNETASGVASRGPRVEVEMIMYKRGCQTGTTKLPNQAVEEEEAKKKRAAVQIQAHARRRAASRRTATMGRRQQRSDRVVGSGGVVTINVHGGQSGGEQCVPTLPIAVPGAAAQGESTGVARRVAREPLAILRQLRDRPDSEPKPRIDQFRLRVTIRSAIETHVQKTGALRRKAHPLPTLPRWRPSQSPTKFVAPQPRVIGAPLVKPRKTSPLHTCVAQVNASIASTNKARVSSAGPSRVQERLSCALFSAEALVARQYAREQGNKSSCERSNGNAVMDDQVPITTEAPHTIVRCGPPD